MWLLGLITLPPAEFWLFTAGMACAVAAGWFTWRARRGR